MNQENMWWIIDLAMRARVFQYFPRPGWRACERAWCRPRRRSFRGRKRLDNKICNFASVTIRLHVDDGSLARGDKDLESARQDHLPRARVNDCTYRRVPGREDSTQRDRAPGPPCMIASATGALAAWPRRRSRTKPPAAPRDADAHTGLTHFHPMMMARGSIREVASVQEQRPVSTPTCRGTRPHHAAAANRAPWHQ
jgi:hypothetical protein